MSTDVSVIVVNWNTREFLRDCLRSIHQETIHSHEIIVVDNASHDGSIQMVTSDFPDVVLLANSTNLGFAAANNQALKLATGRYVLLLNPDTVILDGAIDKMIAWCDERPNVGCAGCQILATQNTIQNTCFSDPSLLNVLLVEMGLDRLYPKSKLLGRPQYSWWDRRNEMEVDVVSGMFMLMPRSVIAKVGLLDEKFFIYAEEADLCRRIRFAGLRCVFTPIARILHLEGGGKSTDQIKPRMYIQLQKSLLIYLRKHDGLAVSLLGKIILLISKLLRLCLFSALAEIRKDGQIKARANLARISVMYHLFGAEP